MHFVLFDEILEQHTVRSLERALVARGHQVTATGPIWKGHFLPKTDAETGPIRERVREISKLGSDVLFNFRPSSLLPDMVKELKTAGIHTVAWFADDPVLYHICYRHVVDAYDTVLHCGGDNVLSFYQERHGTAGFNFPFWTDDSEFRYTYDPAQAEFDLVFLGSCDGKVRAKRYELLSSLPFKVRIYGKVKNDPYHLRAGYLETVKQISDVLGRARCAISIPQNFGDYMGTEYDFPELVDLGHFELPSRVVQYAAVGLPIISLEGKEPPCIFPELIACSDREELIAEIGALLKDGARLYRLSSAVHARFKHSFSAYARAAFLESIVESPQSYMNLGVSQSAVCFMTALGEQPQTTRSSAQAIGKSRATFAEIETAHLPMVNRQGKLQNQPMSVKNSFSYRLGNMLVRAVANPGRNTILLPYRLTHLCCEGLRARKARAEKSIKYSEIRLSAIKLSALTAMIKEKYIERFGVDKDRLGWYKEDDWRRVEYISSLLPGGESVLDIGTGSGAFLNLLMSLHRFQRILGTDVRRYSKFTMLFERQLYQIVYASVTNLPFADKSIDIVTCMEVLEHIDRQSFMAALPELRRVSRFLIVTVPYNEPEPLPSYHKLKFTDKDLLTYFPHGEFILLKKSAGADWMVIVEHP